jgi:hypothetical protein
MKELDVINQMLGAIGTSPVTTILNNQHPDVLSALAVFNRVNKKVQSMGWWFNTDKNLTLAFNPITKEVIVPSNTLGVDPSDPRLPYIQRGTRMYDPSESTFEIGTSIIVNIKQLLVFSEVPETVADYIAAKSSYEFVIDNVGDQNKLARLEKEVRDTLIEVRKDDIRYSDTNISSNPTVANLVSGIRPSN